MGHHDGSSAAATDATEAAAHSSPTKAPDPEVWPAYEALQARLQESEARLQESEGERARLEEEARGARFDREAMLAEVKREARHEFEEQLAAMAEQYQAENEALEAKLRAAQAAQQLAEERSGQQLAEQLCSACGCLRAEEEAAQVAKEAAAAASELVAHALQQATEEIVAAVSDKDPDAWAAAKWREPEPEPEPRWSSGSGAAFMPGLHFATRSVVLRESPGAASEDNRKVGQLDLGEVVYVSEAADNNPSSSSFSDQQQQQQQQQRLYCRSLVDTTKQGWASRVMRPRDGNGAALLLLQRIARPANMPLLGETYIAKQRIPVRDRAEVSSARIGWLEPGELLRVDHVRMDDTDVGRPKVKVLMNLLAGEGYVSFWDVSDDTPVFDLYRSKSTLSTLSTPAPTPASEHGGGGDGDGDGDGDSSSSGDQTAAVD
jgi:hypothetical protein